MKGKFIVLEGLDGAGTTTQANLLIDYLKKKELKVCVTKEPTDNIIGGLIRGQLTKHWKTSPLCLQLLFAADRASHLEKDIKPALKKGAIVLCDRYVLSSLAFGGIDVDIEWLKQINSKFPVPDLTIFLDTEPDECIKRMQKSRFSLELFEEKTKLRKVKENYLKIIKRFKNLVVVDGNRPIPNIFTDIRKAVEKIL